MTLRVVTLLALSTASAFSLPLIINFDSSLRTTNRGDTITFSASIFNSTGATVFINGDSLNVPTPLIVNDTPFLLNAPLSIAAGVTTPTFPFFNVTVPLSAPFGLYPGRFDILGGGPADLMTVGSATFAVNVVPEPGTVCMLLAGAVCLGLMRRF
jgi:hypothetical protein